MEFWFLLRRDGYGFFGIRLTYPYKRDRKLEKGELRHELAHIMVLLSEPNPKDVVIDPFAGKGAIPFERATAFPYQEIFAFEKDNQLVRNLKKRLSTKNTIIVQDDALFLKTIQNNSIDKIITDPPWGIYKETQIPLEEFYSKMLQSFFRILKPDGILVILIGQPEIFEKVLKLSLQPFRILSQYNILVSGKKATLYKIKFYKQ